MDTRQRLLWLGFKQRKNQRRVGGKVQYGVAAVHMSQRRLCAVYLSMHPSFGGDLRHVQELLGHTSIKAVRKLVECDPANFGAIVARII